MQNIARSSYQPVGSNHADSVAISLEELNRIRYGYMRLVNDVKNNASQRLQSIDANLLNHIDEEYGKPLLSLACEGKGEFRGVNAETVQLLINAGAEVDWFDQQWYGWEALHYAAVAADKDKLKVICSALGQDRVNTLTTLSENALHLLLDHGPFAESFNVSCENGDNLKMSRVIGGEKTRLMECAKILVSAGVDVNHPNFWNETPVLIAIKRKYFEVVKLFLQMEGVDLDSCWTAVPRRTARELLKEAAIGPLPTPVEGKEPGKILFEYLKAGDEDAFLKFNGGNIRRYVDTIDGDNFHNSSCTLLQYCFRRGFIACYQDMKKYEYEALFHYSDITANHLVQVFCRRGMVKCIQHLLDNGAHINFTEQVLVVLPAERPEQDSALIRKFGRSLLEVAAVKGYYPLISIILERDSDSLTSKMICDAIVQLMKHGKSDIDLNNTLSVMLYRLLNPEQPVGEKEATILKEVLNLGVKKINKDNLRLLLKIPGSLCTKITHTDDNILEEIDPEIIQNHLDECVEQRNGDIYINYESFIKDKSTKEVEQIFLKSPTLNVFLKHLVFKILINRKWEHLVVCKNVKYFYLNLLFYLIYYFLLNVYVLLIFHRLFTPYTTVILVINVILWLIMFLKEVVQVMANNILYMKDCNNYAEIFLIIIVLIFYITSDEICMVLTVLSSNLVLLLLLEQVPILARYIIILRTAVFYLKYILFYFIQFLAFAICFYILFSKPDPVFYKELPNKLFETVILFTGNLDYMDTNKFGKNELFSKIIFVLFVIFMAIILNNLLLGLLVNDMNDLNKSVKLFEQMKRASFVVRLQNFFLSKVGHYLPKRRNLSLFDEEEKYLKVNDIDRNMLDEDEKQHLDFILCQKVKSQNSLKKLYSYIKTKVSGRSIEKTSHEIAKKTIEKLQLIEERIKNLHDVTEIIKSEVNKINVK